MRRIVVFLVGFLASASAQFGIFHRDHYFEPKHRLAGIGVDRKDMTDPVLAERTRLLIDSQTFGIMRDPRALAGAARITSPALEKIFEAAAKKSGEPASLIAAIAYLESWGDPKAESPAGPRGIMQFSKATAQRAGLKITYATRYRITTTKKKVKVDGKVVTKTVSQKTPYMVPLRDERLMPELAVPAAAMYLARMEEHFGGRDLAVFAYHCGEGCVADFISLAASASGLGGGPVTVPRLFFAGNPARNRELYEAIRLQMARDYSPTYFFRVKRAEELLAMYKSDPAGFGALVEDYKDRADATKRASNRLNVWLKPADVVYQSCEDLKRAEGKGLERPFDRPPFFGFQLRTTGPDAIGSWDLENKSAYLLAAPSAVGTLTYIAFETRRMFDAMKPKNEKFVPLEVTSLVRHTLAPESGEDSDLPSHCTGQVFDIAYDFVPLHEKEALDFILEDMGWGGYLGFIQASGGTMHIGSSPSSREFFAEVFREAAEASKTVVE